MALGLRRDTSPSPPPCSPPAVALEELGGGQSIVTTTPGRWEQGAGGWGRAGSRVPRGAGSPSARPPAREGTHVAPLPMTFLTETLKITRT